MKDDYLSIKHVENGFTLEMNAYADKRRRGSYVARNEQELYDLIRQLFPAQDTAVVEANFSLPAAG